MPNSRAIAQRRSQQARGSDQTGAPATSGSRWQNRLDSRRSGTDGSSRRGTGGRGVAPTPAPPFNAGPGYRSRFPSQRFGRFNGDGVVGTIPPDQGPRGGASLNPDTVGFQPGEGAAFQRQLQGRTAPAPVISSGNSQQRIVPGVSQPAVGPAPVAFSSIQPGTFNSTSDPSNPLGIDRDALARAAFGNEGFTNKMAIQAEDYSKVLANGLGGNANGFTLAGNLMGGQAPGVLPGASNFAAAAGMNQLVNPVVDAESSIGFPGVVQASFNPAADLVPSGPGATVETTGQEQAAQDFANQAVSRARETQNRMREIRGMPLLVD